VLQLTPERNIISHYDSILQLRGPHAAAMLQQHLSEDRSTAEPRDRRLDPTPLPKVLKRHGPRYTVGIGFFFLGVSKLQERNQVTKSHPSKGPAREWRNPTVAIL